MNAGRQMGSKEKLSDARGGVRDNEKPLIRNSPMRGWSGRAAYITTDKTMSS